MSRPGNDGLAELGAAGVAAEVAVQTPAADGALGASRGDEVLPDAEDRVLERDLATTGGLKQPRRRALRPGRMCEERLAFACRDR